jgi:hypothetical protein
MFVVKFFFLKFVKLCIRGFFFLKSFILHLWDPSLSTYAKLEKKVG